MNDVRIRGTVSGHVQGVSFRWATRAKASRLGLSGWVRNLADGRVEFEAEGPADAVDQLVEWARQGPETARVSDVELQRLERTGEHGFAILY